MVRREHLRRLLTVACRPGSPVASRVRTCPSGAERGAAVQQSPAPRQKISPRRWREMLVRASLFQREPRLMPRSAASKRGCVNSFGFIEPRNHSLYSSVWHLGPQVGAEDKRVGPNVLISPRTRRFAHRRGVEDTLSAHESVDAPTVCRPQKPRPA